MRGKPQRPEALGTKEKDQRERMKGKRKLLLRYFLGIKTLAEPEPKHRGAVGTWACTGESLGASQEVRCQPRNVLKVDQ